MSSIIMGGGGERGNNTVTVRRMSGTGSREGVGVRTGRDRVQE